MPPNPQVHALTIRDYKGVAELNLPIDESLTLLAGVNGVGKTSVIEALLGAVTHWWSWLAPDGDEAWFSPSGHLVRYGVREGSIALEVTLGNGVSATSSVTVNATDLDASFSNDDVLSDLYGVSPPPLVVYYDQNRIGGLSSRDYRSSRETNRKSALDTTPGTLVDFKNWFFEKESDEAREAVARSDLGYADPEVRAVREVLAGIAGGSAVLRSRLPDGSMDRMLYLRREGGFDIPFEALSGGELAYFLLAVDLARRLLLEFPGSTLAEAPGFVCIDEIELHLHPAWQRQILTALMEQFPGCQFVVSTHSPQVIGSVAARHVRLLSSDANGRVAATTPLAAKGRDSNYVLEGIMGTHEQDPRVAGLFAEFDQFLDAGALDDADRVLDTLDELIEGGSARVAVRRPNAVGAGTRSEGIRERGRAGRAAHLEGGPACGRHRSALRRTQPASPAGDQRGALPRAIGPVRVLRTRDRTRGAKQVSR